MEINTNRFIKIMSKNFKLKVVNTPLGQGVVMNRFSAFVFSSITGAGYLDDPLYPFTPKGLIKVFYNAFDYKFVTGIFDNTTLKNTPLNLSIAKKFLFDGDKTIIPVEFENEKELQLKLESFIKQVGTENKTKYIIQRIEKSKKGYGMEPFLEYLTSEYLKNKGFVVETQIPLSHNEGSPDFGGYSLSAIKGCESINKAHLIELALIRLNAEEIILNSSVKTEFIVGEAKTSTNVMSKQLDKYLNTKIFNKGFEIHANKKKPSKNYFGLITIDDEDKIKVIEPLSEIKLFDKEKQQHYGIWLSNYFKYYLIANLTNDEFNSFYLTICKKKISSKGDIISFVNNLSIKQILEKIKGVSYGTIK